MEAAKDRWHVSCMVVRAVIDRLTNNLEQYMNLLSMRQKLVASNIANADTPGYKTKDLDFQSDFQAAMTGGSPQTVEVSNLKVKNDGNNVDLDREARLLAENAMRFNVASNLMHTQLQQVRSAIQEGKSSL
jgi:flagellar basal-body rod protein FlgB